MCTNAAETVRTIIHNSAKSTNGSIVWTIAEFFVWTKEHYSKRSIVATDINNLREMLTALGSSPHIQHYRGVHKWF